MLFFIPESFNQKRNNFSCQSDKKDRKTASPILASLMKHGSEKTPVEKPTRSQNPTEGSIETKGNCLSHIGHKSI